MAPRDSTTVEESLNQDLLRHLGGVDELINDEFNGKCSEKYQRLYRQCLRDGLLGLLGQISVKNCEAWEHAMQYGRAVISNPQDNERRAAEPWADSVSDPFKQLLNRFGMPLIEKAHHGASKLVNKHHERGHTSISHINKKKSFLKHRDRLQTACGYSPSSNPLASGCYEIGVVGCSIVMGAWTTPETAVRLSFISHVSMSDDYASFTKADYDIRIRMVALAAGAAFHIGIQAIRAFLDGTCLKAIGTSPEVSVAAAMAWRAASGCSTIYSKYVLEMCKMDEALMPPEIMLAVHDMMDWRTDAAAGNYENGLSALYGMGVASPFHTYLEAIIQRSQDYPYAGIHAIAGMMIMSYTASRYSSYEYNGSHKPGCEDCVRKLRHLTTTSGFQWAPRPPPRNSSESYEVSVQAKRWTEYLEDQGLAQLGASWFQYLVSTGEIWLFDVLEDGVSPVHVDIDWV